MLTDGFFGRLIFLVPCRASLMALGTFEQRNAPVAPDSKYPSGLHCQLLFPPEFLLQTPFSGQLCFFSPLSDGEPGSRCSSGYSSAEASAGLWLSPRGVPRGSLAALPAQGSLWGRRLLPQSVAVSVPQSPSVPCSR